MVKRSQRGFSMLEMVIVVAIFAVILVILTMLEGEMKRFDRSMRLQLLSHPEPTAVLARVRRDVLDSNGYPSRLGSYEQTPQTLLLSGVNAAGAPETIVYDFTKSATAVRLTFDGDRETSRWQANAVPQFTVTDAEMPDGGVAVRLQAISKGNLIVDAIIQPRSHP